MEQRIVRDFVLAAGFGLVIAGQATAAEKVAFGTNWLAQADEEIAEGTMVQIIGKDNITLKVKSL